MIGHELKMQELRISTISIVLLSNTNILVKLIKHLKIRNLKDFWVIREYFCLIEGFHWWWDWRPFSKKLHSCNQSFITNWDLLRNLIKFWYEWFQTNPLSLFLLIYFLQDVLTLNLECNKEGGKGVARGCKIGFRRF